jgi:hypothetical protein
MACEGNELHEHFNPATGTFIEHKHMHDRRSIDFNNLHHHDPEDHYHFSQSELKNFERDTGRTLENNAK